MPKASYVQDSFLGGQWSPFAQGRLTHPDYKKAMRSCLNAFPIEEGACPRRSGLKDAGLTRLGKPARAFSFGFSEANPYTLEVTNDTIRYWNADQIATDNNLLAVTGISSANPAVFTLGTTMPSTWATGTAVVFSFGDAGVTAAQVPALANRHFFMTKISGTTFSLLDEDGVTALSAATLGIPSGATPATLLVAAIQEDSLGYTAQDISVFRRVQTDDNGVSNCLLMDGMHAPLEIIASPPPDASFATFSVNPAVFKDGPYLDPIPGTQLAPSAVNGNITLTLSFTAYVSTHAYNVGDFVTASGISYQSLTALNVGNTPASSPSNWAVVNPGVAIGPNGFVSSDIGRMIRLFSGTGGGTLWTWGKITGLSVSGIADLVAIGTANIGDMTFGGGLAGAFHTTVQPKASSANSANSIGGSLGITSSYVGKNFSSSAKSVAQAVVHAPTDIPMGRPGSPTFQAVTISLRGSNTAPTSALQGTVLASVTVPAGGDLSSTRTLNSNDISTTFGYIWVAFSCPGVGSEGYIFCCGRLELYSASVTPGSAVTFQVLGAPLASTDTVTSWQLGLFTDTGPVYPICGCYHEGRLWLSGAVDNRFDASNSNDVFNFAPTGPDGTVGDGNAISGTLNSSDTNPIFWMMPDLQGIIIGTQAGEWLLQASNANNVLTPTSIQAHRITKYGCANIEPVRTGLTTCFVQKFKRGLYEYLSDVFSGKFYAPHLTELAKDVTRTYLQEIAYQEELAPIVWARRGDGALVGCTYRRISMLSHEPPEFRGWHEHSHGAGHEHTSISVGPSIDGNLDALTSCTLDPVTGLYHVQVMAQLFDEEDEITSARFLDSYIVPAVGSYTSTGLVLKGLHRHDGKTITAFVCGLDCGDYTVASGQITVPFMSDPDKLFTLAYMQALSAAAPDLGDVAVPCFDSNGANLLTISALVGYVYMTQGQILPPMAPDQTGARTGPAFGKVNRHNGVAVLLHNTVGVSFGTDFDRPLKSAVFKSRNGKGTQLLTKNQMFSGTHYMVLDDEGVAMDNSLCWQVTRPYPCTVVALGGFDSAEDR